MKSLAASAKAKTDRGIRKAERACGKANVATYDLQKAAKALRECGFHNEADSLDSLSFRVSEIIYEKVIPGLRADKHFAAQLARDVAK